MVRRGHTRFDEPVKLASGELSRDFIDGKRAFSRGADLRFACEEILRQVGDVEFDAVGGLTMGADPLAHVIAVLSDRDWFVVRKEPKGRGTNKLIEGCEISPATRVLLVDDVVTTGGSIRKALAAIEAEGATVVAAATLMDRGETAGKFFTARGVPYAALVTYKDLGIEPVGRDLATA